MEVARLRALEEEALLALIEKEERASARAGDVAAAKERRETREALAAVHDAKMGSLQERLNTLKRARTAPRPRFLTKSYLARMDKGVPRPPAGRLPRPDRLGPSVPPRDAERPVDMEDGYELLEVHLVSRIFLVGFSVILKIMLFAVCWCGCEGTWS